MRSPWNGRLAIKKTKQSQYRKTHNIINLDVMKVFRLSLFYATLNHMIAQFSKHLIPSFSLKFTTKLWYLNFTLGALFRPLLCVITFSNQSTHSLNYFHG